MDEPRGTGRPRRRLLDACPAEWFLEGGAFRPSRLAAPEKRLDPDDLERLFDLYVHLLHGELSERRVRAPWAIDRGEWNRRRRAAGSRGP